MMNKRIIYLLSILTATFAASPCVAIDFREDQIQSISKSIKKGHENDPEVTACSSFSLNKRQVVVYFKRARVVQGFAFHDLDWSVCSVDGAIKKRAGLIKWQINALCSGVIEWPNGKTQFFYYDNCDRM